MRSSSSKKCGHLILVTALLSSVATLSYAPSASAEPWASPTGMTGAGLGMRANQGGRVWGEFGFHTRDEASVFSPLVGLGIQLQPHLELEFVLPLSHISVDAPVADDSDFAVGNVYAALSYLSQSGDTRFKIGGGLALPLADADTGIEYTNLGYAIAIRGAQDGFLWSPDTLSLVGPLRLEIGSDLVFGLDAAPILQIPTSDDDRDVELYVQLAPGISGYAGQRTLLGVRLPMVLALTSDGDQAQIALEPFVRHQIGPGFINARLTLNLDDPLGFAFDDGKFWGLHFGGGVAF